MKPAAEHIPFLDYVRGLAILSVFVFHALAASFGTDHLPWHGYWPGDTITRSFYAVFPAAFGWVGVPIFFTVSGFCIHLSNQRSRDKSYKVFFLRRFFRIYPPYLLALLFFAFVFPPSRLDFGYESHDLDQFILSTESLLSHIFLVHNFSGSFIYQDINGAFWSIAIEAQLYILYPLLLGLTLYLGWQRTLWITGLIELGLHGINGLLIFHNPSGEFSPALNDYPWCYWFSWSIGAALADAYLKGGPLPFRSRLGFLWPFLLLGCYFFKPLFPFIFSLAALTSVYAMSYFLDHPSLDFSLPRWASRGLAHVRWAGVVSYSAYLIHHPLLKTVPKILLVIFHHEFHPLIKFAICLGTWLPIFGLSCCFYKYVELPSIAWGKRVIEKSRKSMIASKVPEVTAIS